ncbi:Transcription initiation factor TFIID subunit 5, partial [Stegodyphus mimosarum]
MGQRSQSAFVLQRHTAITLGVMVWGTISYDSRTSLVILRTSLTARGYVDTILRPVALPFMARHARAIFQQDNARPHSAHISLDCLHAVATLPWPARPPDFSPIEHVCEGQEKESEKANQEEMLPMLKEVYGCDEGVEDSISGELEWFSQNEEYEMKDEEIINIVPNKTDTEDNEEEVVMTENGDRISYTEGHKGMEQLEETSLLEVLAPHKPQDLTGRKYQTVGKKIQLPNLFIRFDSSLQYIQYKFALCFKNMDDAANSNLTESSTPVTTVINNVSNDSPKTENAETFDLMAVEDIKSEKSNEEDEKQSDLNKNALIAVLQFLKKHNLQETEAILRKETKLADDGKIPESAQNGSDVSSVLSTYKSEGDPAIYEDTYVGLKKFIETALDTYRHELSMILYPVFVHMYLELVYNQHEAKAKYFMDKFGPEQEEYYLDDVKKLSCLTKKDHMKGNEFMDNFRSGQFTVRLSRDTYNFLKRHLQDKKNNVLQNIIQEHLYLDVYEGISRTKQQIDSTAGALVGEAARQANKGKVYYGLLKEPEIQIPVDEEDEPQEGDDKPKKKKPKKDPLLSKKSRNDPNAPPGNRVPLPELRDADKLDKVNAMREALKRVRLGPNSLPSICFYTFLNSHQGVTCAEICEDSSLLSAGASDSVVRIWSLNTNKLKAMKPASELEQVDKEADDVLYRMMDERNATDMRTLIGHSGPVYSTSFSPDKNLLLSCSEDSTVRLWSLQTWTNVVCYKGHCFPVWDVKFSPFGYYFASCGHDRTARLWATDYHQPVRIFSGHVSDVDCIQFHPNSNYIATGSSDRTVRLWDVASGNCVRFMTGHKITKLAQTIGGEGFEDLAQADIEEIMADEELNEDELVNNDS